MAKLGINAKNESPTFVGISNVLAIPNAVHIARGAMFVAKAFV